MCIHTHAHTRIYKPKFTEQIGGARGGRGGGEVREIAERSQKVKEKNKNKIFFKKKKHGVRGLFKFLTRQTF